MSGVVFQRLTGFCTFLPSRGNCPARSSPGQGCSPGNSRIPCSGEIFVGSVVRVTSAVIEHLQPLIEAALGGRRPVRSACRPPIPWTESWRLRHRFQPVDAIALHALLIFFPFFPAPAGASKELAGCRGYVVAVLHPQSGCSKPAYRRAVTARFSSPISHSSPLWSSGSLRAVLHRQLAIACLSRLH